MYREILLNSENFNRGDNNHPWFTFPEDVNINYFCIKTVEFPNFYQNLPEAELIGIITYNPDGTVGQSKYTILGPANYPNVSSLVAALNTWMITGTQFNGAAPVFTVVNSYWIGLSTAFTGSTAAGGWAFDFGGVILAGSLSPPSAANLQSVQYVSRYLRRLFGYPITITTSPILNSTTLNTTTLGAIKATRDNYLLLRSNCMGGAMFTPNTTNTGSYALANVIAKIPVNQGTFPYGTYIFYEINDTPTTTTMFTYNGGRTGNFDLYFTRSSPDMYQDVVDFQGWNFSVTLGIVTSESP
jgi:hypothetical protein